MFNAYIDGTEYTFTPENNDGDYAVTEARRVFGELVDEYFVGYAHGETEEKAKQDWLDTLGFTPTDRQENFRAREPFSPSYSQWD